MTSSGIRAWVSLTTSCKSGDKPGGFWALQTLPALQHIQPMAAQARAVFQFVFLFFILFFDIIVLFSFGHISNLWLQESIRFRRRNLARKRKRAGKMPTLCF